MDVILYWNAVALEAARRDYTLTKDGTGAIFSPEQGGPVKTARALAMVHIGMYNAWVGIIPPVPPAIGLLYPTNPVAPQAVPGASAEAAVAAAAAALLVGLYMRQMAEIGDELERYKDALKSGGQNATAISNGQIFGAGVADAVMRTRAGDGADAPSPYKPSDAAGKHRADPYNSAQGYLGSTWGNVPPFCIPPIPVLATYIAPPPGLTSPEYAAAFKEVQKIGSQTSSLRSTAQTAIGLFWAYDGSKNIGTPPRLYNQCLRAIARSQSNSVTDNARLFALVNAGLADAGIIAWKAKYDTAIGNLWRPVLGIREADAGWGPRGTGDGNPNTTGNPFWRPLGGPHSNEPGMPGGTPNFPSYPSGHATFGTTCFELVRRFYALKKGKDPDDLTLGDKIRFTLVSEELNGSTLDADGSVRTKVEMEMSLNEALKDNLESRIFLGVHWRFDGAKFGAKNKIVFPTSSGTVEWGGASIGYILAKQIAAGPLFK